MVSSDDASRARLIKFSEAADKLPMMVATKNRPEERLAGLLRRLEPLVAEAVGRVVAMLDRALFELSVRRLEQVRHHDPQRVIDLRDATLSDLAMPGEMSVRCSPDELRQIADIQDRANQQASLAR